MRERIDRERAAEQAILDWVVTLCELQETAKNLFLVENLVSATSWNQPLMRRLRSAPLVLVNISHLWMFGVEDQRRRRSLKRFVRYMTNSRELLKFVVRQCPNEHVHEPVK